MRSVQAGFRNYRWMLPMVLALTLAAQAGEIVQTVAGGGSLEGYKPDEANLLLGASQGLALSAIGEIYVSDSGHHQVIKINPSTGAISIVAGNGTRADFGDGTPAPSAGLDSPGGLAFDAMFNLYIVDRGNFKVRRVDALSGIISTVAGTGLFTGEVVGANPPAPLGDGAAATAATFGTMNGIAIDPSGAIFIADAGNDCIRKFTVGGSIATVAGLAGTSGFAGDGTAGGALTARFNNPAGLAFSGGSLFIADSANRRVRKLDAANTVTTVAGDGNGGNAGFTGDGGAAASAQIGSLGGLAFDSTGVLLITCQGANRIRRVDVAATTPIILTIAGNGPTVIGDGGPATGATLATPRDVAVDSSGNIYIYDAANLRVRRIDKTTGFIDTVVGTGLKGFIGDRGPNQNGVLVAPSGAAFDAAGNLYIADTGNDAVRRVAPDGTITTLAGSGTSNGLGDGGAANLASLDAPTDVAVFGNTLFIADSGNDRIRAVDLTTGIITTYVQLNGVVAVIADAAGALYVARNNQVDRVAIDKTVTAYAGNNPIDTVANPLGNGLPAANAAFDTPSGLALNAAGDLFVADTGNDRIRKISAGAAPMTSTVAGGGAPVAPSIGDGGPAIAASLNAPVGVAIDAGGRLLISDTGNQLIRAVNAAGVITSIAGTGVAGFSGDGDVAITALVNSPGRITLNGAAIVFADVNNNRIRKLITVIDLAANQVSFSTKLSFKVDKKTGLLINGKDSVAIKASLPLPAGIAAANLKIQVDVIDLHQQVQLDANGKLPRKVKAAKSTIVPTVFDFTLPKPAPAPVSKFSLKLKGVSLAGAKPAGFSFSSKGTFREELGRAGFTNVTTAKEGVPLTVRVNITLGTTTFSGVATVLYKATQAKGGSGKTVKP